MPHAGSWRSIFLLIGMTTEYARYVRPLSPSHLVADSRRHRHVGVVASLLAPPSEAITRSVGALNG